MVQVIAPTTVRPPYYDRQPVQAGIQFISAAITPHALTVRATYTVPNNRAALLMGGALQVSRSTVAGTPGEVRATLDTVGFFNIASVERIDNALAVPIVCPVPTGYNMLQSAVLRLQTLDAATGGANDYGCEAVATEYAI